MGFGALFKVFYYFLKITFRALGLERGGRGVNQGDSNPPSQLLLIGICMDASLDRESFIHGQNLHSFVNGKTTKGSFINHVVNLGGRVFYPNDHFIT